MILYLGKRGLFYPIIIMPASVTGGYVAWSANPGKNRFCCGYFDSIGFLPVVESCCIWNESVLRVMSCRGRRGALVRTRCFPTDGYFVSFFVGP